MVAPRLAGELVVRVVFHHEANICSSIDVARASYLEDTCKSALNRVPEQSRVPFRWINPYRGCTHSCHYRFARAFHTYLDLGVGEDFWLKIAVKMNVVEVLRRELASPRWEGEAIAMGTATDPYQHCEGRYRLTRGVVEALADFENPMSMRLCRR